MEDENLIGFPFENDLSLEDEDDFDEDELKEEKGDEF
jgi:hypothetical protein